MNSNSRFAIRNLVCVGRVSALLWSLLSAMWRGSQGLKDCSVIKAHRPFVPRGKQECLCHWRRAAWQRYPRDAGAAADRDVCVII